MPLVIARRMMLVAAAALGVLVAVPAAAQAPGKVARVGYLHIGASAPAHQPLMDAFRARLRELGWIEGHNLAIEHRFAEGQANRLPELATELVRAKVDVIVGVTRLSVVAARKASGTTPIVMLAVGDPVGTGLVASLARPGGNVTGVAYGVGMDTIGKGLELLKEAVPKARRVAFVSNQASPSAAIALTHVQETARSLRVKLQLVDLRGPEGIAPAFAAMAREKAGAALVVGDPAFDGDRARIVQLALQHRLPAMYSLRPWVEAGGLMSYGPHLADMWRRGADYVDKILKGALPGELPVQQPAKFELVINQKTAKALGLKLPPALLARADLVLQ